MYETGRVRDHILAGLPHLLARVPGLDEYWMLVEPQGCPDDKGVRIIAEALVKDRSG